MPLRPMRLALPLHDLTRLDIQSPSTANDVESNYEKPGKQTYDYGPGSYRISQEPLRGALFSVGRSLAGLWG